MKLKPIEDEGGVLQTADIVRAVLIANLITLLIIGLMWWELQ